MEKWQEEISQVLGDEEARDLAKLPITWTKQISAPGEADRATLDASLKDVAEELSAHLAMWVAFTWALPGNEAHSQARQSQVRASRLQLRYAPACISTVLNDWGLCRAYGTTCTFIQWQVEGQEPTTGSEACRGSSPREPERSYPDPGNIYVRAVTNWPLVLNLLVTYKISDINLVVTAGVVPEEHNGRQDSGFTSPCFDVWTSGIEIAQPLKADVVEP